MKKIKFALFKNLILSSVLLVTIILLTFSWFTQNSEARADGIYIQCTTPPGVEIAVVEPGKEPKETDYQTGTFTLDKDTFPILDSEDFNMIDLTSDGKYFCRPAIGQMGSYAAPDVETDEWGKAEPNRDYLSFDLYVRSESQQTISLASGSKLTTNDDGKLTNGGSNKSADYNFSRDAVVGASRFSIVDTDDQVKLLWIPRPEIMLDCISDSTSGDYGTPTGVSINTGRKADFKGRYNDVQYTWNLKPSTNNGYYTHDKEFAILDEAGKYVVPSKVVDTSQVPTLGDNKNIMTLDEAPNDDGYYVNHVNCNLWIDGEDAEARLALVSGNFSINLQLTSDQQS